MDQGVANAAPADASVVAREDAPARVHLRRDLLLLALGGVLLIAGVVVGGFWLYGSLYSPTAFVERYIGMLADGRAADALAVPGVAVDRSELAAAGLPTDASDALLRAAALAPITDVRAVSTRQRGAVTEVTMSYRAGGHEGTTTFEVHGNGWIGVVPAWRFARSPLAVIDVTVHGSMRFQVNGFAIDKRQVSPAGAAADPAAAVRMLVFSPGLYAVAVDSAMAKAPSVAILADAPMRSAAAAVQAQPTAAFVTVVQERVDEFLTACATQQVLQPTGCPFGYVVQNRIDDLPRWSIVRQPTIALEPQGEGWAITPAAAAARIVVDVRSIYDGSVRHVDDEVPFGVTGTVTVQPDGSASIEVSSAGLD